MEEPVTWNVQGTWNFDTSEKIEGSLALRFISAISTKEFMMVINFEVGKTYRYEGTIGDPSPFMAIGVAEQDALFIVSGKALVCTYVENSNCPEVGFKGVSRWAFISLYDCFEEVLEEEGDLPVQEETPAPRSEAEWEKKYAELEERYNKLNKRLLEMM